MKILVIQQKKTLDVLLSTILIDAIKQKYPYAEIHYLVEAYTLPILENHPNIDEILNYTTVLKRNKLKFLFFLKKIKKQNYDIVIDAESGVSSAMMTRSSEAKRRIGYSSSPANFVYTQTLNKYKHPYNNYSLAVENRMKLLMPLQISFANFTPQLYLTDEENDNAETLFLNTPITRSKPVVMVDAWNRTYKNLYPREYLARLLDHCIQLHPDIQFLFNYESVQNKEAEKIYNRVQQSTRKKIFLELYTEDLREFLGIVKQCDWTMGNPGLTAVISKSFHIPSFIIDSPRVAKHTYFGKAEERNFQAVHAEDIDNRYKLNERDAFQNPQKYYKRMTPELIIPHLETFLRTIL